jgi:replication factor C small subunit
METLKIKSIKKTGVKKHVYDLSVENNSNFFIGKNGNILTHNCDFLTLNAQAALRNVIESFSLNTRFIFTCNFVERIIDPLQSRLNIFSLNSPEPVIIAKRLKEILDSEQIEYNIKDIVGIVKKTYPDIRRALNVLQSSIVENKLIVKNITDNNYTEQIITEIKSKKKTAFNNIRQIIADNNINDFTGLYKELHNTYSTPETTIIIEEYLFHSTTISDKEICFMSCIAKLLNI